MPIKKYLANYWTKEKVISYIKEVNRKGESLRSWDIRNNHTSVGHASYKLFGNWQKAVESAGIDYKSLLKNPWKWNKDNIKEKLIELNEKGIDLSDVGLRKHCKTFYSAVTKKFGSVYDALEYADIDSSLYRIKHNNKFWTKDKVLAEAKRIKENGEDLSTQNIREKHSKLWNICMKKFGGWINILREIGVQPTDISRLYANTKEFKEFLNKELTTEKLGELYCKEGLTGMEIGEMYGCGYKPIQRLMRKFGIKSRDSIYGIKGKLTCKDGHKVRSSHERKIDNWFYSKGIPHEVEVPIIKGRKYTADFKVDRFFIEIMGLYHDKKYRYHYSLKHHDIANAQQSKSFRNIVLSNENELRIAYTLTSKEEIDKRFGKDITILEIRLSPNQYLSTKEIEKWFGFLVKLYSAQEKLS